MTDENSGGRDAHASLKGDVELSALLSAFTIAANLIGYYGLEPIRNNVPITWLIGMIVFWLVVVNIPLARRYAVRRKS